MSAPVKARPLESVGAVDVNAPSFAAVVVPDVVFAAVEEMPILGDVHPV
jgi:hypothetical protein